MTFEVLLAEYNKTMISWPMTPWSIKNFLMHRRQNIPHKHRGSSVELHCLSSHKILLLKKKIRNQDSSVSIVTGARAGRLRIRVSILAKDMRFHSWSVRRYLLWYPCCPLCDGCFVFPMKRSSVNLITLPAQ